MWSYFRYFRYNFFVLLDFWPAYTIRIMTSVFRDHHNMCIGLWVNSSNFVQLLDGLYQNEIISDETKKCKQIHSFRMQKECKNVKRNLHSNHNSVGNSATKETLYQCDSLEFSYVPRWSQSFEWFIFWQIMRRGMGSFQLSQTKDSGDGWTYWVTKWTTIEGGNLETGPQ